MPLTVKQTIVAMLARREHSQHEVLQKLRVKKYPVDEVQAAIAAFVEKSLLSDHRFTEVFVRSRRAKGYGPERICMELEAHRIESQIIAEHVNITDNAWFNDIRHVWQKRFKGKKPADMAEKAKQMRFLQYRGFTRAQIESLFKQR